MQQCGFCLRVYDESEYTRCPYCAGLVEPDFEEDEDENESFEPDEKLLKFIEVRDSPGIFDDEGEWVRCPICGTGLHDFHGTPTCPNCYAGY
jgi:hypothetical protein